MELIWNIYIQNNKCNKSNIYNHTANTFNIKIIEHSDICGDFNKKYGNVKVFRRKFYVHLTLLELNIEFIETKTQIRFNKSLMIQKNLENSKF